MAPDSSWTARLKATRSAVKGLRQVKGRPSIVIPPPASPRSATPSTYQSTPCPPPATSYDTSSLQALQERLWNEAYDELKRSNPKLIRAYEKILSVRLRRTDRSDSRFVTWESPENDIGGFKETRCHQMQQLVQDGLDRTQKVASVKRRIDEGLQVMQVMRGIIDKAVQAAPQAAVAWVGVCLGLEILSNPVTEAGYNRDGIAYILSRMEWYWSLTSLLLDENRAEQSSAELRVQLEKNVVQLYEKLLSYQIKSVCLYHRNSVAVLLRDIARLDDWTGQLAEIQEAEAAVRTNSDQYNTEQRKAYLRDLTFVARSQEEKLKGVHWAIEDQTRQREKRHQDEKHDRCMQDLHVTDPRKDKERIQDAKGGLLRDSYRWILDHTDFQRFRDDPQNRLLWIKGDPGKGKTMLLCGIIDELENGSSSFLSYFFCQATEVQLSNATSVLRGLIYLLILQQPSLISYIRPKHDVAGEKLFQGINAWLSLVEILTGMLKDPILKDAFLIVDALDECIIGRPQLLDFIIRSSSAPSYHVKWIVSSRNWQDIEEKLDHSERQVRLHLELNENSISKAIEAYIAHKVEELASLKRLTTEMRDTVQRHLIDNAHGTFLWVALVCQELANPRVRRWHTLETLKSFPPGLNSLYDRMMGHIADSKDTDIYREVLSTVLVVYRPVTLHELKLLAESLRDLDLDDLEDIVASCGSFLALRQGAIHFVHQSAKDFLLGRASERILPLDMARQHCVIFSKSLGALSEALERDVCKLGMPGFPTNQVLPSILEPLNPIRYSCIYWVDHLHDSEPTKISDAMRDDGDVQIFIQEKYLYWLETLGLLRDMAGGMKAIQKLQGLVERYGSQQLMELIEDARRFILYHKRAIEIAPLQVYASALIFSPERSVVRRLFEKEEPGWLICKPRVKLDWSTCLQTLEGHDDLVMSVVYSADGQRLISSSGDKTIKIWDVATGACLQTLEGHDDCVNSVVFSADGQRLASGSGDKTIKIWDAATGACSQTLEGHDDWVDSVVFSVDERRLVSGSRDKTIKIWDAVKGACLQTLEGHGHDVTSVVLSADGQRLASGSRDKTIKIWDAATGACLQTLEGHDDWVESVVFSVDERRLVSGSRDKTIKIWDAIKGACPQTLEGHGGWVRSVVYSVDGQHLASSSDDQTVKIWEAATGACLQTLEDHGDLVMSAVFSADGQRLVSGSADKTVKIWNVATGACLQTLEDHDDWVTSVVFSADGQRLASGSGDKTIKIWDAATGACSQTLEGHDDWVTSVVFSVDGQRLVSRSTSNMIKIWDAATGACLQTLEDHDDWVASVVFSVDGRRLVSGSGDKTVKIWDAATGACLQTLEGHDDCVNSVVFSADGQRLASGSGDKTIKIWDAATGACLQTLEGHDHWVKQVVFSADGQHLVSGSADTTIKIWDAVKGACLQTLEGHGGWVRSVVYSADGQRLASSSRDKTVKIWDAATGACLQTVNVEKPVWCLSFESTTNSRLYTDIGLLNLGLSNSTPRAVAHPTEGAYLQSPSYSGYSISINGEWIMKDGTNVLWLPSSYRPEISAVAGSKIAIGSRSGRVLVMKFS